MNFSVHYLSTVFPLRELRCKSSSFALNPASKFKQKNKRSMHPILSASKGKFCVYVLHSCLHILIALRCVAQRGYNAFSAIAPRIHSHTALNPKMYVKRNTKLFFICFYVFDRIEMLLRLKRVNV